MNGKRNYRTKKTQNHYRHWRKDDDHRLRMLWDAHIGIVAIANALGRRVTSVAWRAAGLGLSAVPTGCETFSAAQRRTGYYGDTLRRILDASGVPIYMSLSKRPNHYGNYTHSYVEPTDVDDAVRRWLSTETLHVAAQRVRVCDATLQRWLAEIGVVRDVGSRKCWRVSSIDVDRAVEHGISRFGTHRRRRVSAIKRAA